MRAGKSTEEAGAPHGTWHGAGARHPSLSPSFYTGRVRRAAAAARQPFCCVGILLTSATRSPRPVPWRNLQYQCRAIALPGYTSYTSYAAYTSFTAYTVQAMLHTQFRIYMCRCRAPVPTEPVAGGDADWARPGIGGLHTRQDGPRRLQVPGRCVRY